MTTKVSRRVVHATSAHQPTDARIYAKECLSLARAGYSVTLVAPGAPGASLLDVRFVPIPPTVGRWRRVTTNVWAVTRRLIATRAAVYHLHDPELIVTGLILRALGRRVIYDAHENFAAQLSGRDWLPRVLKRVVAFAARRLEDMTRPFSAVVAATPSIAARFRARATVIHNFPPKNEFATDGQPYGERENSIGYIGGASRIRGIKEMVEAMARLDPSLNARLDFAGKFEPATLAAALSELPGWARVSVHEWMGRADLARLLGRVRIGLVVFQPAPNHIESYPTKLFEYMAAGLPVIASDFPVWRDLVAAGGFGLVVDPSNPLAIADAIEHLLRHPDEAEAMGARGRAAVAARLNWETEEVRLLDLYRSVIGESPREGLDTESGHESLGAPTPPCSPRTCS